MPLRSSKVRVRVALPSSDADRSRLLSALGIFGLVADAGGSVTAVLPLDVANFAAGLFKLEVLAEVDDDEEPVWDPPAPGGYHSDVTLRDDANALVGASRGMLSSTCIGKTFEGRDIMALRLAPAGAVRRRVLLVGGHHARERISVEVIWLLACHLVEQRLKDKSFLVGMEIVFVPMLNPDGHAYTAVEWNWRKNRSPQEDRFGVDLNRNYPIGWGTGQGSSNPAMPYYRGPQALSEYETQALAGLLARESFDGLLSYHSFAQAILYPWAHVDSADGDSRIALLAAIATKMAALSTKSGMRYASFPASQLYGQPVGGELCDFALTEFNIAALSVELGPNANPPGFRLRATDILGVFDDHLPAALMFLDWVRNANFGQLKG